MSTEDSFLPHDVQQLQLTIVQRDAVIAQLDVGIIQCDAAISQKDLVIAAQHETIEQQLSKLDRLHQELARLLRRPYDPQQERVEAWLLPCASPFLIASSREAHPVAAAISLSLGENEKTQSKKTTLRGAEWPRTGSGNQPLP